MPESTPLPHPWPRKKEALSCLYLVACVSALGPGMRGVVEENAVLHADGLSAPHGEGWTESSW